MSDDFGTVNVRRGDRGREIELLRQQYLRHRDAVRKLAGDAPTEHLAAEYSRVVRDIETSLSKLDEIADGETQPGTRQLVTPNTAAAPFEASTTPASNSRLLMIVAAGAIVLALIAWLIYRASDDRRTTTSTPIVESPARVTDTAPDTIAPVTPVPIAPAESVLAIVPAVADYGTIRKGTRATRQIEVTNKSGEPVTISVSRSQCRCLYYEYRDTIAPKKKETITVTVDGARAKAGSLEETIDVKSKKDPSIATSFQVSATVQ